MSYYRNPRHVNPKPYQGVRGRDVKGQRDKAIGTRYHKPNDLKVETKQRLVNMLRNAPCVKCGQRSESMHFHHRDPKDKKFNVSDGIIGHTIEELMDEIRKCDLLCVKCHLEEHRNRGEKE